MNSITQKKRAVLEGILERYLHEIALDPQRSIRSLVDLGKVASGNQLQSRLVELVQQLLEREDSPYYAMIQNAVHTVDHQRILSFGIDLGWHSLTQGAKQLRRAQRRLGCAIPWCLSVHLNQNPGSLDQQDCLDLIAQGRELGIFCYFLFPEDLPSVELALTLALAQPECAFCLLLPGAPDPLGGLPVPANVILGVDGCAPEWELLAARLQEEGQLYLIYRTYRDQDEEQDILSGRWAEQILPRASLATLLVGRPQGNEKEGAAAPPVTRYARQSRLDQRYPTLMLDFYQDALYTSRLISGVASFLEVLPDGVVHCCHLPAAQGEPLSLRACTLAQACAALLPAPPPEG